MKIIRIASACAIALGSLVTPVLAQGFGVSAGGDFGNIDAGPYWDAGAKASLDLGSSGLGVEAAVGDEGFSIDHVFNVGGSLTWSDPSFRIAGTVLYNRMSFFPFHSKTSETSFGYGGEWYVTPWLTASAEGGGMAGRFSGGFGSGDVKAYLMPDLAISGVVGHAAISSFHWTDYGATAEWLPIEAIPVSIKATYVREQFNSSVPTNMWMIGLRIRLQEGPETTLVGRQRTGTLDTIGVAPGLPLGF